MAENTPRTVTLKDSHLWQGQRFGPGVDIEVPEDFPAESELKGLDAPAVGERNLTSALDRNAGGPPAENRSSDTEENPREIALEERIGRDGATIDAAYTGDRDGGAVTGLHTVSHPEDLPVGGRRTIAAQASENDEAVIRRVPVGGGRPDGSHADAVAASGTSQGGPSGEPGTGNAGATSAARTGAPASKTASKPAGSTGLSREALEDMTVPELHELAQERGVTVKRGDGGDGSPLKEDYVTALARK